jgi:FAD/FMN-containing dehydrogenase
VIKSGGKVVKNVAGYDLAKLFIGSQRSLGVIGEATFKLRPLPEAEQAVSTYCESLEKANALIGAVLDSEMVPVVLDLHNISPESASPATCLVLGFAGTREEVAWQTTAARELGIREPCTFDYDNQFRVGPDVVQQRSVLPSRTVETIRALGDARFVARAGNGVIYYRGGPAPPKTELPAKLTRRLKDAFDPKRILPEL